MSCDCEDQRWIEWVRVNVENKAICSICGKDIPNNRIEARKSLKRLDYRGVKASTNGKTP